MRYPAISQPGIRTGRRTATIASKRSVAFSTVSVLPVALLCALLINGNALHAQETNTRSSVQQERSAEQASTVTLRLAVALRALTRGDTLTSSDFALIDTTITWRWSMPSADSSEIQAGWIAQRAISAGEVLRVPSVRPPTVIAGGSQVKAIFEDGPVRIVLIGTAVTSATLGAPISVRINRSRRLNGIAIAPGIVQLR